MAWIPIGVAAYNALKSDDEDEPVGKDTTKAPVFSETKDYDPNRFEYGGTPGLAEGMAGRYRWQGDQAQTRGAAQADFSGATPNYSAAAPWMRNVGNDRTGQNNVAGLMMGRATGATPSIAGMQSRQDIGMLQQAAQQQARAVQAAQGAQAASARGAAGVALAGQSAANNTANAQSAISQGASQGVQNISNQAQINAANERMQAEQSAFGAYSGMRQGDAGMINDQAQRTQFNAGLQTEQQKYNAGLQQQQHGLNDAFSMDMAKNEQAVRDAQMRGNLAQQATMSGSQAADAKAHIDAGAANAQRQHDMVIKAGDYASRSNNSDSSGDRAGGGPIMAGRKYQVGEEGEEAVIPLHPGSRMSIVGRQGPEYVRARQNAVVIPAPQTAMMLANGGRTRNGLAGMGARDKDSMLDDRYVESTKGTVGQEVLRKPYKADEPGPWAGDITDPAHGLGGHGVRYGATPNQQRAFEDKLTGAAPSREQTNASEADKIRASFGHDDATQQWERSNGSASGATAGARDAEADPAQRKERPQRSILSGLGHSFGFREEGGPIEKGRDYVVGEKGPEAVVSTLPAPRRKTVEELRPLELSDYGNVATGIMNPGSIIARGAVATGTELASRARTWFSNATGDNDKKPAPRATNQPAGRTKEGEGVYLPHHELQVESPAAAPTAQLSPAAATASAKNGAAEERAFAEWKKYNTPLTPAEEDKFQEWKSQVAPGDSGADYDYRGAYKAGATPGPDGHWVDTFKKPNHQTFSNESQYARGDDAAKAGRWDGDTFVPAAAPRLALAKGGKK